MREGTPSSLHKGPRDLNATARGSGKQSIFGEKWTVLLAMDQGVAGRDEEGMRRGEQATFSASGAASSALSPHAGKLNCPKIDYCGLSLEQTQFPSPTKDSQSNSQISDSQSQRAACNRDSTPRAPMPCEFTPNGTNPGLKETRGWPESKKLQAMPKCLQLAGTRLQGNKSGAATLQALDHDLRGGSSR
ncbi:hypothetical protein LI328DRAFT_163103 [Trichoderma asperelloides]|nr:hypothetical protein LI328DRAFT_163103 [Trichoderma asperelloides]